MYIVSVCHLADEMKDRPSVIHTWSSRDRALMLAYYEVKAEIIKEQTKNAEGGR